MLAELQLNLSGAEPRHLVECALTAGFLPATPPTAVRIGGAKVKDARLLGEMVAGNDELSVTWGEDAILQYSRARDHLTLHRSRCEVSAESLVALLRDMPFEACTTSTLDPSWWQGHDSIHGWAFAIKGEGHRLVSQRVIDRGPWRLHRDGDLTVFQFHDLDVDEGTALAQAAPGHALLAPMWQGGHYAGQSWAFKSNAYDYKPQFYERATQTSVLLIHEGEAPRRTIGIAAGSRIHQLFTEQVSRVRIVYMDEEAAKRQLEMLWLYSIESYAMTGKGEIRIDAGYVPLEVDLPSWV
ncbi:hypothetical protein [Synechococcus sp. BA-132 BA5]|uniref:hypothetical protein n=1 Tax=Synechococcus sp. BA-132 BA5 TaxID=3110252 RepID=UPI002B207E61|nr:hypothetical protein [Synechococcus sp. BA-132 BA5]MEA5415868.1 hypothetical protein [Synechococcus sp. BA-132 BA5]